MQPISRRETLQLGAASLTILPKSLWGSDRESPRKRLGLVTYAARIRRDFMRNKNPKFDLFQPIAFLRHCHALGAGGMQCSFGKSSRQELSEVRNFAEQNHLFVEGIVRLPEKPTDVDRFEMDLKSAAAAGAKVVRTTIIPGRRYEYFPSLDRFQEFAKKGKEMLQRGTPVAEKHRIAIAVENHKDQRNAERIELFEQISSEYVGACVDTGNSVALLEDPIKTIRDFAPWAHAVHLKDQALKPYDDGFLLADIPLGQGALDLREMVGILRMLKPHIQFSLELISRDPLKVPCLSDKYWATFPELPGVDLARTLRMVNSKQTDNLQYLSKMSPDEKLIQEDKNVRQSLDYARDALML